MNRRQTFPSGPATHDRGARRVDRVVGATALALLALWIAARVHGAFSYPPLLDFDAAGHLLYAASLVQGRLPPPESWLAFQPPLYYAAAAGLWCALPAGIPVHAAMRLLSGVAALSALTIVFGFLRRRLPPVDAALATAIAGCAPAVAIAATMLGNETTCALFSTAALAHAMGSAPPRPGWRRDLGTGVLAALAVLAKSTGLVALAFASLALLIRDRRRPRRAAAGLLLVGAPTVLLAGPFYVRLALASGGSPLGVVTSAAHSPSAAYVMSRQPPGERRWRDYLAMPASTWTAPHYAASPELATSVAGLLYASAWSEAHGHYVPPGPRGIAARRAAAVLGIVPTLLGLLGALSIVLRGDARERLLLGAGAALLLTLAQYAWALPRFSAVKASYLLPALLPAALALGRGLGALPRPLAVPARGVVLLSALGCLAFGVHGWWSE